jgi:endoglucanase
MVSHTEPHRRRTRLVLAAAAALLVTAGVGVTVAARGDEHRGAAPGSLGPGARPASRSAGPVVAEPLTGKALHVDPTGAAAQQVREFQGAGRDADARLIRKIADRPTATWFTDTAAGYTTRARALVTAAAKAGRLPVLAMYNIPHRDCSGQSAGGASGADAYRTYVTSMAEAMQGHRAVVILEPDAVAQAVQGCLDPGRTAERFALLAEAVRILRRNPGVLVYLDAGNPTWITDTGKLATALRTAGVADSSGFSLNVANFESTAANIAYGTALSRRLDGAHFVVDTSRNGNGPAPRGPRGDEHWCNPPGRRLGPPPTTRTGHRLVDAYLWVKRPGESDGACGNGAPPAGQWWAGYALALTR